MLEYNKSIRILIAEMLVFFVAHVAYAKSFCTTEEFYAVTGWVVFFSVSVFVIKKFVKEKKIQLCLYALLPFVATHLIGRNTKTLAFGFLIYLIADIMFCILLEPKINIMFIVATNISFLISIFFHMEMITERIPWAYFCMVILFTNVGMVMTAVISLGYCRKLEENEKQYHQLLKAQKSKDEFLANMSHEIRTPMNSVCGMTELLLRDEELSEESKEYAMNIQSAGRSLLGIINDILDFSKIETGKMKMVEEPYQFHSVLNDVIVMAMARKGGKNLEIIVDCDPQIPRQLVGDELRLKQVMLNLMTNAIKFTNEGGILLSVTQKRTEQGIDLNVSVRDTGIGIKEEDRDKLYQSFQQLDTRKNRNVEGTGLGLAISKRIISQMGGFIEADSVYGEGSEFRFTVPQRIYEDIPGIRMDNAENIQAVTYLHWEDFRHEKIREWYRKLFLHLEISLNMERVEGHSLKELKELIERREDKQKMVFLTKKGYEEDSAYFDEIGKKLKIIVVMNQGDKMNPNSPVKILYKPFYLLSIVNVISQKKSQVTIRDCFEKEVFTAPEAKVLIVDDNAMNLKVTRGLLEPYRLQSSFASSGMLALEKVKKEKFDLIFMDHMMPGMDGVETAAHIREMGGWCEQVPIIALTANAIEGVREMFQENGFQGYAAKPVELSQLERILKKWLPKERIVRGGSVAGKEMPEEKFLKDLHFNHLDTGRAIEYFGGNEKNYLEALETYLELGNENRRLLEDLYADGNWEDYTIKIHSLKSASRIVGAVELSEEAERLEVAGRSRDVDCIMRYHGKVMEQYGEVLREVRERLPEGELETGTVTQIGEKELEALLDTMQEALKAYDMDELLTAAEQFKGCVYKEESVMEILRPVQREAEQFDYEETARQLEMIREEVFG